MEPVTYKVLRIKDHLPDSPGYNVGGKVVLPESFLIAYCNFLNKVDRDMPKVVLFKLTTKNGKWTHCGNLEFTAPAGCICLPEWMQTQLELALLDEVEISVVALPKAKTVCFKPSCSSFMKLDQKVLLEKYLRAFNTLTVGDTIPIKFNERDYSLKVVKTEPGGAVNITDCNVEIDYLPADDEAVAAQEAQKKPSPGQKTIVGHTIGGATAVIAPKPPGGRGQPDYGWKPNTLTFLRPMLNKPSSPEPMSPSREESKPLVTEPAQLAPSPEKTDQVAKSAEESKFPGAGKTIFS